MARPGTCIGLLAACLSACGQTTPAPPPQTAGAPWGPTPLPTYYPAPPAPPPAWSLPPQDPPTEAGPFYEPDPEGRPTEILRDDAPNMRYAAADPAACETELQRRGIPFVRGEPTSGVLAPERIRGPMHGVLIHTGAPEKVRERSPMEIFDCRLLLALDDFAALASQRGIVEMLHISAYRPKSANGCTAKYPGLQHCAALAVDIAQFKLADGTVWNVQKDFHGHVGWPTCGPTAAHPAPPSPVSTALWSLVCDTADRGIFNVMLTPNYNPEHFNHVHVEVTPDAEWMLIH